MATQFLALGFLPLADEFRQREDRRSEAAERKLQHEKPHFKEVLRDMELQRSNQRVLAGRDRCIDYLMLQLYGQKDPVRYEPYMVEQMVRLYPFNLEILLADIQVFLDFEEGEYLKFWKDVHRRIDLTTFADPRTRDSMRTQNAAIQAGPRFQSYWPR